jgi:hypothetical protein
MNFGGFFRERNFYESRIAIRSYRALRRLAARAGLDVVLKTFYSPIPDLHQLGAGAFDRRSALPGIDLDLDRQLALVAERLAEPMTEFCPPTTQGADPHVYAIENPSYSHLDAAVLYGMIRALKPRQVIELGSGHSTLVTAAAGRRNAAEGAPLDLEVFDPYAAVVTDDLPGLARLHRTPAQQVPQETFERLGDGDVLFVDTTHTVKLGSDVNFIVLEVLPHLAPGVVVHVHDVFLPYEYPRPWVEDFGLYWAEQYLVQAFLCLNPAFEVLCSVAALTRDRGPELDARLPQGVPRSNGCAFWIRRRPTAAANLERRPG